MNYKIIKKFLIIRFNINIFYIVEKKNAMAKNNHGGKIISV